MLPAEGDRVGAKCSLKSPVHDGTRIEWGRNWMRARSSYKREGNTVIHVAW